MRVLRILSLLVILSPGLARASDQVVDAEHDRLSDEMERLAERKIWTGVERKYDELTELGTDLTRDDYLIGAHAARELGDVMDAYVRLKAAARIKGTKEIVDWLWDIDNNYGHVALVAVPARSSVLKADDVPFDPNQRKAVDAAVKRSKQDGRFEGMLPKGAYNFSGQRFEVVPGISVKIEVSPRMRRQGIIDPVIIYRDDAGAIMPVAPAKPKPGPDGSPGDQ
jgi:hypothetical protein